MCSHLIEMWKIWFWCITFTYCLYSWTLLDSSRDNEANPICWWRPLDTAESSWRNLSKWSLSKFFFFFFFCQAAIWSLIFLNLLIKDSFMSIQSFIPRQKLQFFCPHVWPLNGITIMPRCQSFLDMHMLLNECRYMLSGSSKLSYQNKFY